MKSILKYYAYVNSPIHITQPIVPKLPEVVSKGHKLLDDAVSITLAEYDLDTKDYITAHRMKDYRRKTFSLSLLPEIHTMLDDLLEGGEFGHEKL